METGLSRNAVISVLSKSPHGKLGEYVAVGKPAATEDPDFFAHLIAWNRRVGQIRDSKVALPVLAMSGFTPLTDPTYIENAQAALFELPPRDLLRAVRFSREAKVPTRRMRELVEARARSWERPTEFWRTAVRHRDSMLHLYATYRIKPSDLADKVVMKREKLGVFADIARLKDMSPNEAAGVIVTKKIPFLIAIGALEEKAKDPALVQALINAMTPAEVVTNTKMLEKLGVKTNPELRAAYEQAITRVAESKAGVSLKVTVAADAVGGSLGEKLRGAQEKQLDKSSVAGDWLVLADRSQSMHQAIEAARHISSVLARVAAGKVHLVYFNDSPTYFDATGKALDEITKLTRGMTASGGTSIGCGVQYALDRGLSVDGIAVVTDGGENRAPPFAVAYDRLAKKLDKQLPAYVYLLKGDQPVLLDNCRAVGVGLEVFDLRGGVDYYSLPNLVQTMRTNRYDLADEIMATELLRLPLPLKKIAA